MIIIPKELLDDQRPRKSRSDLLFHPLIQYMDKNINHKEASCHYPSYYKILCSCFFTDMPSLIPKNYIILQPLLSGLFSSVICILTSSESSNFQVASMLIDTVFIVHSFCLSGTKTTTIEVDFLLPWLLSCAVQNPDHTFLSNPYKSPHSVSENYFFHNHFLSIICPLFSSKQTTTDHIP